MSGGVSSGAGRAYVPLSVAWLDSLSFEFSAAKHRSRGRDVQYVMATHHRPSGTKWSIARPFNAYREFQRSLRGLLQCGHNCSAQCPWLFTFVTSYFPKPSLFRSSSSDHVVNARCTALTNYMETLRSALLAKENYSCTVLTGAVAEAFTAFICAGVRESLPLKQWAFAAVQRVGLAAESSVIISDEDEGLFLSSRSRKPLSIDRALAETVDVDEDDCENTVKNNGIVCRVCNRDMVRNDYTVTLACGHEFHDECVVHKLNERMSCPACGQVVSR